MTFYRACCHSRGQMWKVIGTLTLTLFALTSAYDGSIVKRQTQTRMQALSGCYHGGRYYFERSLIPTVDSCINCKCDNGLVRCNMTLCPMYPTIQDGCQLVHEEGSCCPQLVCDEHAAKKLSAVPTIHDATLLGCTYNDYEFGLGDFIPTADPCQACYCIHNRTQCVQQNCALPESAREGCRPVYHHGLCCPVRYDCSEALSAPPTLRPPFVTEGCAVNNRLYDEGEAISSGKSCQHCYCMKGEMICAMQKCDSPMAGCLPVVREGQCCPERYECPTGLAQNLEETMKNNSVSVNMVIQTNFPGQKFQSTTRGLEDENDLLGNLLHTTGSLSTLTTPLSVPSTTTIQSRSPPVPSGIPTVFPTIAQLSFFPSTSFTGILASLLGSSTEAPNKPSVAVTSQNGASDTDNDWTLNQQKLQFDKVVPSNFSAEEILPYNVLQTKVGALPIMASEILNSSSPLGAHGLSQEFNVQGSSSSSSSVSSGSSSSSIGQITIAVQKGNQSIILNQSLIPDGQVMSAAQMSQNFPNAPFNLTIRTNKPLKTNLTEKLITHLVGGGSNLNIVTSDNSGEEIHLNTRLNVTIPNPTYEQNKLLPTTDSQVGEGNWTRKAVLLAPMDPTASDPVDGVIHFPYQLSPTAAVNLSETDSPILTAQDPNSPDEVEGAITVYDPSGKLSSGVPFAHLTEVGLAGVPLDPLASDEFEGQVKSVKENTSEQLANYASSSAARVKPTSGALHAVDPTSAEVEGAPTTAPPKIKSNYASNMYAVDPMTGAEIEGALSFSNPAQKASFHSNVADPTSATEVEGNVGSLTHSAENFNVHSHVTDPAFAAEVEGDPGSLIHSAEKASVHSNVADPTSSSEVEGQVSGTFHSEKTNFHSNVADPTSGTEVEGAVRISSNRVQNLAPKPTSASLSPSDPSPADGELEAVAPISAHKFKNNTAAIFAGRLPADPTAPEVEGVITKNSVASTPVSASLTDDQAVDPLSSADVEGSLSSSVPAEKKAAASAPAKMNPLDPTTADKIEGILRKKLQPVGPAVGDNGDGVWQKWHSTGDLNGLDVSNQQLVVKPAEIVTNSPLLSNTVPQGATGVQVVSSTTGNYPLAMAIISQKKKFVIGGSTSLDMTSSSSSTESAGSAILSLKLNGTVPANFMVALNSAKASHPLESAGSPQASSLTTNVNVVPAVKTNLVKSPLDPSVADDFDGQLHTSLVQIANSNTKTKFEKPIDPIPTDSYEDVSAPQKNATNILPTPTASVVPKTPSSLKVPIDPVPTDKVDGVPAVIFKPTTVAPASSVQPDSSLKTAYAMQPSKFSQESGQRNITWVQANTPLQQNTDWKTAVTRVPTISSTLSTGTTLRPTQPSSPQLIINVRSRPITAVPPVTTALLTTLAPVDQQTSSAMEKLEGVSDIRLVLTSFNVTQSVDRNLPINKTTSELPITVTSISAETTSQAPSTIPARPTSGSVQAQATIESMATWSQTFSEDNHANGSSIPVIPSEFPPGAPLTGIYENGCYFDGIYYRNFQAVPTSDLVDPCMVRLCKEGVVLGPSQQRCPPPIEGCFSTSIPGVCCPVYLCPNYLERNETSYTLTAASGDQLNTEKTRLALAKFCRVGPRFLALNERVVHVMDIQCQTCTCKPKGIVCEPGCGQDILITTEAPPIVSPRRFQTIARTVPTTLPPTSPPVTEPFGSRSCLIQKKRFMHGETVTFNDPCHICTCLDGLVICKVNRKGCRSAKILNAFDSFL